MKLWDNYSEDEMDLIIAMYGFTPGENDDLTYQTLYKLPKFKAIFMSIFLNLYGLVPQCYGNNVFPLKLYIVIREMLNPEQSKRMTLNNALNKIKEIIQISENSDYFINKNYSIFDNTTFKGKNYHSVLKRKQIMKKII